MSKRGCNWIGTLLILFLLVVTPTRSLVPPHPAEVMRIMKLLPKIPADASDDEIITMLELPKDCDDGSSSATHCTMIWNLASGYRFVLNFDPVFEQGDLKLVLTEASLQAKSKFGIPCSEYQTVYPYRSWQGMLYK